MAAQVHGFQTEVTKLLKLLANSLYSNKEIFLRELISNASDAVDKLRFLSIQDPLLTKDDPLFHIRVKADEAAGTLTISDNGIGMTLDEANEHLGTIAKSGTEEFFRNLSQDQAKASQLIGQFGVGFYSAFIVADRVTVVSRSAKAAANEAVRWTSDGNGTYESELTTKDTRGTDVILTLKDSEKEFLNEWTLRGIITKYSDHISTPVWLWEKETPADEKKESTWKWVQVNDAKALWTLPPKDVKDEQYKEFYKHLTHDYDDPLTWAHNRVEGDLEYTSLLYIPKTAPWDLYNREQKNGLKLYVQRVFIMDNAEEFLPNYLRFVKGLVDTADLPLNVSREILQDSAVTRKLRRALTKRALTMIGKLAEDKTKYAEFWSQFGRVLKEGPVEDRTNQEEILKLLRFASTKSGTNAEDVSLTDYVALIPEKQKHIYYITAGSYEAAANSPYLETLKKKGIEVLLLWDRVDEWLMGNVEAFDGKTFISATAKDLDLGELEDKEEEKQKEESEKQHKGLVERLKKALGGKVQDVKVTARLVDSPACVVGAQDQMLTQQMRRMLEAAGQAVPEENYTLEINPDHPLIGRMATETDEAKFTQWANFIFAEAQLADQGTLKDPSSFIKSLNELLLK